MSGLPAGTRWLCVGCRSYFRFKEGRTSRVRIGACPACKHQLREIERGGDERLARALRQFLEGAATRIVVLRERNGSTRGGGSTTS